MPGGCRFGLPQLILLVMTAWIVLFALTVLFAMALRSGRLKDPPLPPGYDGERQLAELRALTAVDTSGCGPGSPPSPTTRRSRTLPRPPRADRRSIAWIGRLRRLYADLRRAWRDGAALPPELPLRSYPIARR
jgi:hypothetical protein